MGCTEGTTSAVPRYTAAGRKSRISAFLAVF